MKQHPKQRENKKDDEEPPWTSEIYIYWNLQTVIAALFTWLGCNSVSCQKWQETLFCKEAGPSYPNVKSALPKKWHLVRFRNKPTWLGWGQINDLAYLVFWSQTNRGSAQMLHPSQLNKMMVFSFLLSSHHFLFCFENLHLWSVSDHWTWCQVCPPTSGQLIYWSLFLIGLSLPAVLSFCSPLSVCHNTSGAKVPFLKICFYGG